MNPPTEATGRATPWHLWLVGVLALLWNGVGAFDFVMTQTRNAAYMGSFTPEQLAHFYGFPLWVVVSWGLGVWGGVLGSCLLLWRKRSAVPVFAVSLATMVLTWFYNFVLAHAIEVMGGVGGLVFSAVIVVVALALWWYARRLARVGLLQ